MNIKLEDLFKYQFLLKYPNGKRMNNRDCIKYIYKHKGIELSNSDIKYLVDSFHYNTMSLRQKKIPNSFKFKIEYPKNIKIFEYINIIPNRIFKDITGDDWGDTYIDSIMYLNTILFSHIRSYKTIDKCKDISYLKNILINDDNIFYPYELYEMIEEFTFFISDIENELNDIRKEYMVNPPEKLLLEIPIHHPNNELYSRRVSLIYAIIKRIMIDDSYNYGIVTLPLFTIIVYFLAKKYNICNFKYISKKADYIKDINNFYRGKSLENKNEYSKDEWVYGDLIDNDHIIPLGTNYSIMVDKNTVSKYIGRVAVHNKKIFDGDIVEAVMNKGIIEWDNDKCRYNIKMYDLGKYIIIGNKWDNPELLSEITANKLIK